MTEYGRIHTDGSRSGGDGELLRVDIDDGKYTFIQRADGGSHVLRYSEPWLAELPVGSNCWLAMAYELQALRQPTQSSVAAAGTDRIGGGGGLPCGVAGVATQSDADMLADKSDDYAIGFLSVLLERELYENGHTIGEDLAERLAEIAVKTVCHPPQSDALRVTDEMVERLAVYIAKEEARNCKTLGAAVEHRSNWRRIIPEAREMLTAALRQPTQSDALLEYYGGYHNASGEPLERFIIPAPKPDPLVDVFCKGLWSEAGLSISTKEIRAALDALGFEIRKKNDD